MLGANLQRERVPEDYAVPKGCITYVVWNLQLEIAVTWVDAIDAQYIRGFGDAWARVHRFLGDGDDTGEDGGGKILSADIATGEHGLDLHEMTPNNRNRG
ncbi:MAG: hypothetical protein WCP55_18175 [Lentisphaerota bacterium]